MSAVPSTTQGSGHWLTPPGQEQHPTTEGTKEITKPEARVTRKALETRERAVHPPCPQPALSRGPRASSGQCRGHKAQRQVWGLSQGEGQETAEIPGGPPRRGTALPATPPHPRQDASITSYYELPDLQKLKELHDRSFPVTKFKKNLNQS